MRPSSVAAAAELSASGRSTATAAGESPVSNRSLACLTRLSTGCAPAAVAYRSHTNDRTSVRTRVRGIVPSVHLEGAPGIHTCAAPRGDEGGNGGDNEKQRARAG